MAAGGAGSDTCFIAFRITLQPPERFSGPCGTRLAFNHLFIDAWSGKDSPPGIQCRRGIRNEKPRRYKPAPARELCVAVNICFEYFICVFSCVLAVPVTATLWFHGLWNHSLCFLFSPPPFLINVCYSVSFCSFLWSFLLAFVRRCWSIEASEISILRDVSRATSLKLRRRRVRR